MTEALVAIKLYKDMVTDGATRGFDSESFPHYVFWELLSILNFLIYKKKQTYNITNRNAIDVTNIEKSVKTRRPLNR